MGVLLSTESVNQSQRFEFWHDLICKIFVQLEVSSTEKTPFYGLVENNQLDFVQFTDVISSLQRVERTKALIAQATEDYFLISFQLAGEGIISQDGRVAHLRPGDWTLYDSTRPYELNFQNHFKQLVLQMSRKKLMAKLPNIEALTACPVSGNDGMGKVTLDFVLSSRAELANIESKAGSVLAETTTSLLITALGEKYLEQKIISRDQLARLVAIKGFISEHLTDPQLSVGMIAKAHAISPRYLHTLFENENTTIARYIREMRLEKCKVALSDQLQQRRTITEIAFGWGFSDSAHFSRLFESYTGFSPKEYRRQSLKS